MTNTQKNQKLEPAEQTNNILIAIKNVKKQYRDGKRIIDALKGVSIQIFKGEILGLLGANGAGKTTLSSLIATLHPATSGMIMWNGQSIYDDIPEFRKIIGLCPQKPNLNTALTVEENLVWAGIYYGLSKQKSQERAQELMQKYKLTEYAEANPSTLSGGYKQRVIIARSLMHSPKLIILDEPTVGLDPHIRHELWENIRNLKNEGVSVLLTTHYLDEAEILSDRICILEKGKVRLIDTPENLKTAYDKSKLEDVFIQLMHEETEQ